MHDDKSPWWLTLLDKHGFTTLFAVVCLYGGWKFTEHHFKFLEAQTHNMQEQTEVLKDVTAETHNQTPILRGIEASNQRQEEGQKETRNAIQDENQKRKQEHEMLLEALKQTKKPN